MGASPQMVDWDEDGDMDLLVGEYDGHIHYFRNIGTATNPVLHGMGHLQSSGADIDVSQLAIPVVNDWNEDGKKDLIVGNDLANIKIFINTGTDANPVFSGSTLMVTTPPITQIKNSPDIGDLNGDGLKDLAFGWWQGTVVYYPNSGTNAAPVFSEVHTLTALGTVIDPNDPSGGWTHLELNDWDEDGDLDLLYGEWSGTIYVHLNVTGDVTVGITPVNPPIIIPGGGGSFDYNISAYNGATNTANVDVWIMMKLQPSGPWTGPYLNVATTLPAAVTRTKMRTQIVPGTLLPGTYTYEARIGDYPNDIWDESSFTFVKTAAGSGHWVSDFDNFGESFEEGGTRSVASLSESGATPTMKASPNPFNPTTAISYQLSALSFVNLSVYDIAGKKVAELVNGMREAGMYSITFDGSKLTSGVYIYQLEAGKQTASGKMVLMK